MNALKMDLFFITPLFLIVLNVSFYPVLNLASIYGISQGLIWFHHCLYGFKSNKI
jgi:hypothetical protein